MDQKVLMTQVWLNNTYSGKTGYIHCDEDGATGNGTIASLISALQIEIGVSPVTGEFGPLTASMCPTLKLGSAGNKVNILQGALWCKGYSSSDLTKTYDGATIIGVNAFKKAAGLPQDGEVDPKTFKGILSTDAVVWGSMGDPRIQEIQRGLNSKYSDCFWKDLNICPVDGAYGRNTCNAMLYAFQQAIGVDEPNGTFGPTTSALASDHNVALWSGQTELVVLLQYMLYVNGFDPGEFDGGFGYGVQDAVINFQELMALEADGIVGLSSWAALLISKGNVDRDCNAVDSTDRISLARARNLKSLGVNYSGRYLNGYWRLSMAELKNILAAGLKYFPIYQRSGYDMDGISHDVTKPGYFTFGQGQQDGAAAIDRAQKLGLPIGTTIYFAVDFDVYDYEVDSNILPYFRGVNSAIGSYNVGIYAPRYVCTRVGNAGYASKSFVSDMSTAYSGNIGQRIPSNWAFDQFYTTSMGSDGAAGLTFIHIDKVMASGRDSGVSSYSVSDETRIMCQDTLDMLGLQTVVDWSYNVKGETTLGNIKIEYKVGMGGSFTPILNSSSVDDDHKFTFSVEDGRINSAAYSNAVQIYNGLSEEVKLEMGKSDTLQPMVSLVNTMSNGQITLSTMLDGSGNFVLDVLIEHTEENERKGIVEVKYTIYKNDTNKTEIQDVFSKNVVFIGAAGVSLLLMALCTRTAKQSFEPLFIIFLAIFSAFNL